MFSNLGHSYQQVSNDDKINHEPRSTETPFQSPRRNLRYIVLGLALLSIILVTSIVIKTHQEQRPSWSSCGSTPKVARQRGCSFDLISFAWQTPECFDSSLSSEFATWDKWNFYTEKHGNISVPLHVALVGEQNLWVTWHYHMVHCTFMWRQMHRAYERGWIDAHLHAYNHTLHCQKALLKEGLEDSDVGTQARVIYPVCDRVGRDTGGNFWDSVYSA